MALTRSMLKAMGIEDEKIESIISAHSETVEALKGQKADLQEQADKVPSLEQKIQELEAAKPTEDWEAKYKELEGQREALRQEFDDYKTQVAKEQAEAEKAKLYRAILTDAGIDAQRIDAVMRVSDLSTVEVENGEIKNAEQVAEQVAKEWAAFIPQQSTTGAKVATPPQSQGNVEGSNPEVKQRLQERHERLYGKAD